MLLAVWQESGILVFIAFVGLGALVLLANVCLDRLLSSTKSEERNDKRSLPPEHHLPTRLEPKRPQISGPREFDNPFPRDSPQNPVRREFEHPSFQANRVQRVPPENQSETSAGVSLLGIASGLIFTFAVSAAFRAHNALSSLSAGKLFRGSSMDTHGLLLEQGQAQSYANDRLFWSFIALIALGGAIGCLLLKRKR